MFEWPSSQSYGIITFASIKLVSFQFYSDEPIYISLIVIAGICYIDGILYLVSFLVLLFVFSKNEVALTKKTAVKETSIVQSYKTMLGLFCLPSMQLLFAFFIFCFVGMATVGVHDLRLLQKGISVQVISLMNLPLKVLTIVWSIGNYHPKPLYFMNYFYSMIPIIF
jgi:hypothetical protein